MKRLIDTTFALGLATLLSPALALGNTLPIAPDLGNQLLDRETHRLAQRQNPSLTIDTGVTGMESSSPQRDATMLASRRGKDRDHGHYKRSKGKHRGYGEDHRHHHHHDHWDRHDHGHIHYYRPLRYWGYDRYYEYYDGVNLNLILHLDG